jgi:hypothetical protein
LGHERSVDHLVGDCQQARWKFDPERPCRCAIEYQLKFGFSGVRDELARLRMIDNAIHAARDPTMWLN